MNQQDNKRYQKNYNRGNNRNNKNYNNRNQNRRLTEEQFKALKEYNKRVIKKVQDWQAFKFIKHLVCADESCRTKLVPKEVNNKVILECPKCKEVQSYIPKVVLKTKFFFPLTLFKNRDLHSKK